MAKKKRKQEVSKSSVVREYLASHPEAMPAEVQEALADRGIRISRGSIATIKSALAPVTSPDSKSLDERLASLTARQREVFEFTKNLILNRGYGPSVREIGEQFSIRSPNGVICHLRALEKKGLIHRASNISRAIELADKPATATSVKTLGEFSAGKPLSGEQTEGPVEFSDVLGTGDHACVVIEDDSCQADGLNAGDYVLIRTGDSCDDGDAALVLIDGRTVDLKRYRKNSRGVRLEPLAGKGKAIRPEAVTVLGVVTGVVRKVT